MFNTLPITEEMHIHSLNGELRKATILKKLGDNDYLAEYNGVKCHAIYNPFVNTFYVDDKYGIIRDKLPSRDELCR
ncbi:hypothetical protein [Dehalobacter sp. 14DCB1]|uniref:hypothetical protein n=1 Tax=Dehalobacter sp. 14DCB1 TaxID=2070227 RepID=UPI001050A980|nr:hypothetical protein [Dehalobacter sp. 14DCB1]TCX48951.1 hypothetical protein C1I36_12890 [Dehalobacter sp. 14DCB1]